LTERAPTVKVNEPKRAEVISKKTKAEKRSFYLSRNSPETGNGILIIVTFLVVLTVLLKRFSSNFNFIFLQHAIARKSIPVAFSLLRFT